MIVVFANDENKYDFIVQTSIDFALAKVGGPIGGYDPTLDFTDVEKLALVGHGMIGMIETMSAEKLAIHLADSARGVTAKLKEFVITSCFAGSRRKEDPEGHDGIVGTSLVEVLAEKLRGRGLKGLKIVGYRGPSIKSAALGGHVHVVNATLDGRKAKFLGVAIRLQEAAKGGDASTLNNLKTGSVPTIEQARAAEEASEGFYAEFVRKLEAANLLKKGDKMLRVVEVAD